MYFYSNTTTGRLEAFARRQGLQVDIVICRDNKAGRYFVVRKNNKTLMHWEALGWTVREAQDNITSYNALYNHDEKTF